MDYILRRMLRATVRRGKAGDWTWLAFAGVIFVLRRALRDRGGVVSSLKVAPGEQVLISVRDRHTPSPGAVTVVAVDADTPVDAR